MDITQKEILNMSATIIAGLMANPALSLTLQGQYDRQSVIQETIQNVTNAVISIGFHVVVDDSQGKNND